MVDPFQGVPTWKASVRAQTRWNAHRAQETTQAFLSRQSKMPDGPGSECALHPADDFIETQPLFQTISSCSDCKPGNKAPANLSRRNLFHCFGIFHWAECKAVGPHRWVQSRAQVLLSDSFSCEAASCSCSIRHGIGRMLLKRLDFTAWCSRLSQGDLVNSFSGAY